MSKGLSKQERLIRIELARTRAALERQNVARSFRELHDSLTLSGLWHSLFARRAGRRSAGRRVSWLSHVLALSRRYPFLLTSASAALSSLGRGRTSWVWRLGLGALAGWRVFQSIQDRGKDVRNNDLGSSGTDLVRDKGSTTHPVVTDHRTR